MIEVIVICSFVFLSLGMYTRLQKFGAPFSAILYAGAIPFSAILFNLILGIKYVSENKEIKGLKKVLVWVIFQIQGFKKLSLVTTLVVVKIGSMKLRFWDLVTFNLNIYLKAFNKFKGYVEQQVEIVFNSSYEELLLKQT